MANTTINASWRVLATSNDLSSRSLDGSDDTTLGAISDDVGLLTSGDDTNLTTGSTANILTSTSFSSADPPTGAPITMPSPLHIVVPTGTYTIEVRFAGRHSGGTTYKSCVVRNRHMWAWTESFVDET